MCATATALCKISFNRLSLALASNAEAPALALTLRSDCAAIALQHATGRGTPAQREDDAAKGRDRTVYVIKSLE